MSYTDKEKQRLKTRMELLQKIDSNIITLTFVQFQEKYYNFITAQWETVISGDCFWFFYLMDCEKFCQREEVPATRTLFIKTDIIKKDVSNFFTLQDNRCKFVLQIDNINIKMTELTLDAQEQINQSECIKFHSLDVDGTEEKADDFLDAIEDDETDNI